MVEVLFGVVNFILCGFNQARGHGAKIIALGILNCVGRLVGTAVRFFSCGPYDFTPVRLDFCNWGKIRASSLYLCPKTLKKRGGGDKGSDIYREN